MNPEVKMVTLKLLDWKVWLDQYQLQKYYVSPTLTFETWMNPVVYLAVFQVKFKRLTF